MNSKHHPAFAAIKYEWVRFNSLRLVLRDYQALSQKLNLPFQEPLLSRDRRYLMPRDGLEF